MKRYPFNLADALKGAKVVTGEGCLVTNIALGKPDSNWPVTGAVHKKGEVDTFYTWSKSGWWLTLPDASQNLFMADKTAPQKKKIVYWTNFYPGGESVGYSTRKEADEFAHKTRIGGKARKVVLEVAE